jgi:ribonuclease BN (tRNA processing enzyme)
MKITVLGTRGKKEAQQKLHSKHSGVLIDEKLLIDVGEKEFLKYVPEAIFFTHLHPDHAWFIETHEIFDSPVPAYSPEVNPLIKNNQLISSPIKLGDYTIIPVPTIHSIKVHSQGYVVEKGHQRIFYSGDMVWIEKKHHHLLKELDLVITDGSFIRKGGAIRRKGDQVYGHTGIPDLIRFFKKFTQHIVFTHFGTWFMKNVEESKDKIKALETPGLKIEVAYDGKEYIV